MVCSVVPCAPMGKHKMRNADVFFLVCTHHHDNHTRRGATRSTSSSGTVRGLSNEGSTAVKSISFGPPHVRPIPGGASYVWWAQRNQENDPRSLLI